MNDFKEVSESLIHCYLACLHCADACLDEPDIGSLITCIRLDYDCADICKLAVNYLYRDSLKTASVIEMCATICAECAEECEKHDHNHCTACAKACRQCEENCRTYLRNK